MHAATAQPHTQDTQDARATLAVAGFGILCCAALVILLCYFAISSSARAFAHQEKSTPFDDDVNGVDDYADDVVVVDD